MAIFISRLPDSLLENLTKLAKKLKMFKNKSIEKALKLILMEIEKAQYAKSFRRASKDKDVMAMAEEGMADYSKMLQDFDKQ